ncbi:MAG: hypothetical protein DRK00_08615 [Thermoprotei archaeon]|nr:MAG: hypothetical protein DRK00_08615 [Thermoprotei archaeon]
MRLTDEELLDLAASTGVKLLDGERLNLRYGVAFKVDLGMPCETYVLDSPEGRDIAARPELVGEEFIEANLRLARAAAQLLAEALEPDVPKVFLHVLRGSLGYRLHEALKLAGVRLCEVWIRPKYVEGGFGDHRARAIRVVYEDFKELSRVAGMECDVIVADTVATGYTLIKCLQRLGAALRELGVRLRTLVLYGFVSLPGLSAVLRTARARRAVAIAIEDFTALASNMYDMPLYGVDEAWHAAKGELRSIGGVTTLEVLRGLVPHYAPGMDQPGDWSERQPLLHAGDSLERGDIAGHLKRSLEALRRLWRLTRMAPWYRPWMEQVCRARERGLSEALARLGYRR